MSSMHRLTTAVLASALLCVMSATVATAQEEEPPMPPPGDRFAALLSGSASFVPNKECPFGVLSVVDASGVSTIGEVSLQTEHCATLGAPTVPAGRMTMAVEGGDQITGTYFVDCSPPLPSPGESGLVTCPGRYLFAQGTGAFSEVVGTAHTHSYVWFPGTLEAQEWPWIAELHGSIGY